MVQVRSEVKLRRTQSVFARNEFVDARRAFDAGRPAKIDQLIRLSTGKAVDH
jgi:hypothetical protein